jgi:hypothetical protein
MFTYDPSIFRHPGCEDPYAIGCVASLHLPSGGPPCFGEVSSLAGSSASLKTRMGGAIGRAEIVRPIVPSSPRPRERVGAQGEVRPHLGSLRCWDGSSLCATPSITSHARRSAPSARRVRGFAATRELGSFPDSVFAWPFAKRQQRGASTEWRAMGIPQRGKT